MVTQGREELLAAAARYEVALAQKNAEVEEERRKLKELAEAHTSLAKHKNQIERELEAAKLTIHAQATQNTKPVSTKLVPASGFFSAGGCPGGKKVGDGLTAQTNVFGKTNLSDPMTETLRRIFGPFTEKERKRKSGAGG